LTPRKQISTLLPHPLIGRGKACCRAPIPRNNSVPAGRAHWPCFLAPGSCIRRALKVLFGALLATQNDQSQK
jgi:hypothetical protein